MHQLVDGADGNFPADQYGNTVADGKQRREIVRHDDDGQT
jgi:hypothetical protein